MNWPSHGANPHYLYESFNLPFPEKYIDFSVNVNPFGKPDSIAQNWSSWLSLVSNYPDPKVRRLTTAIAKREQICEEMVLIGNGGAELIFLIGMYLQNDRVVIVQPAFSEYEEACTVNGCEVFYHQLTEDKWRFSATEVMATINNTASKAIFLCTPNNPTGVVYDQTEVSKLISLCYEKDVKVIIDEAFYDFYSQEETYSQYVNEFPNLIVIRSLTKMYAIAGLRLGYVLAHKTIIKQLSNHQPHWSVNNLAIEAGLVCLEETDFVQSTVNTINEERERLFTFFSEFDFAYSNSLVNFYLLKDKTVTDQLPLFQFLLKKGLVPRHTANFPGLDGNWLRFAIKQRHENDLLLEALKQWRAGN